MRILIFGCGYLGRRVAELGIRSGYDVSAVTRSPEKADVFRSAGIKPVIADVCDSMTIRDLPDVDVVLNSIGFDRNSRRTHEEVTCGGLRNFLAALGTRRPKIIQISSTSVYGQTDGEWVDETSLCDPQTEGGRLNLTAEQMVLTHENMPNGAGHCVLRLAGIYGPGRLLSRIELLKASQPIAGAGEAWLNLIHVDDAALAVATCMTRALDAGIYNVVDDEPILRSRYFGKLAQLVGAPAPTFDPGLTRNRGSAGINKRCSNLKLRRLGWAPRFPTIDVGLPHAIDNTMNASY